MTSISGFFTPSTYQNTTAMGQNERLRSAISDLNTRIAVLQQQQTSGKKAYTHGGLGSQSLLTQNLRHKSTQLDGFIRSIGQIETRLGALQQSMSQLHESGDTLGSRAMIALNTDAEVQLDKIPMEAEGALETIISSLNSSVEGRYLFSGAETDTRPVASMDAILNGTPGRMGLREFTEVRLTADAGAGNDGRLSATQLVAPNDDTVRVSHDGSPFGLRLMDAAVNGANVSSTLSAPTTVPRDANVTFGAGIAVGENVVLTLGLPNGETFELQMTAINGDAPDLLDRDQGVFQIGTTPAGTAANFQAALTDKISELVGTELAGASNMAAADEFFDGKPPRLPDGANPATATTFRSASAEVVDWFGPDQRAPEVADVLTAAPPLTPADAGATYAVGDGVPGADAWAGQDNTIATWDGYVWHFTTPEENQQIIAADTNTLYSFDSAATPPWQAGATGAAPAAVDPLDTVTGKIDEATTVSYGARADEDDLRNTLKNAAIMAAAPFDPNDIEPYHALVSRAAPNLVKATTDVVEHQSVLGVTQERVDTLKARHGDVNYLTKEQINRIENVDEYDVATELLEVMNQLQATYQITGKVSQLSLVNFI